MGHGCQWWIALPAGAPHPGSKGILLAGSTLVDGSHRPDAGERHDPGDKNPGPGKTPGAAATQANPGATAAVNTALPAVTAQPKGSLAQVLIETKFAEFPQETLERLQEQWPQLRVAHPRSGKMTNGIIHSSGLSPATAGHDTTWVRLSQSQYPQLIKQFEQLAGVDIPSAPRITTLSSRQAQIQVGDQKSVVMDVITNAEGFNYVTTNLQCGPMVDVVPTVSGNGQNIHLLVKASVTEFLGYLTNGPPGSTNGPLKINDGPNKGLSAQRPTPQIRRRLLEANAQVAVGETVLMMGEPFLDTFETVDRVPYLSELPLLGQLFVKKSKGSRWKYLLMFVTATPNDEMGKPIPPAAVQ